MWKFVFQIYRQIPMSIFTFMFFDLDEDIKTIIVEILLRILRNYANGEFNLILPFSEDLQPSCSLDILYLDLILMHSSSVNLILNTALLRRRLRHEAEAYRKKILELHPAYISLCTFSPFLSREKSCEKIKFWRIILLFTLNIQVSRNSRKHSNPPFAPAFGGW